MKNRRLLDSMPYDKQGMHATGYEVCIDDQWWDEYADSDGELYYMR